MNEMRAALYDSYGPPDVLYVGTLPKPLPGPGEVLVRVHATSVNGGELPGRAGRVRLVTGVLDRGFPKRVGIDFAGEVVAVGEGVTTYGPGDRVWGVPRRFGAAAEFVAVDTRRLAPAPANIDLVRAAALPGVGTTAITALRDKAHLQPGERLLVRGASGGVGSVAVQLGHMYGAHVTALANAKHHDALTELGADEVLDYRTTSPADLPRFDVVLDTVGTEFPAYRGLLTRSGRMVAIAFDLDHTFTSLSYLVGSTVFGGRRVRFFSGDPRADLLAELTRLTDTGALRPVVDTVFPLAEIAEAHRVLEAGGVRGKLVIQVS
ncbi:NAD(P)-dependent alcohol dehydrogenase [Actinophytocola glycyrrhizae]|uniref:NAD(P)-dependent alcohol dehydrogenase n=1 Tax=Actinophytocola glycyrrhizae TaxID=2044873 RepID=A0ABV9S0E9_9PSEU